jgi:hypothetical protein
LLPEHLDALPADADEEGLCNHLVRAAGGAAPWFKVPTALSVRAFADLLEAHRAVLGKEATGLLFACREADPGIWVARNVRLHPTVQFFPPVYVGENCDIGGG